MTLFALLFTLAAIGLSESAYLVKTRLRNEKPVCIAGESCHLVLGSKYGHMFGFVHNDVLGIVFYICVIVGSGLIISGVGPQSAEIWALRAGVLLGACMSIVLTFIQWKILKNWCFWCLLSAATNWLMAVLMILHFIFPSFLSPSPV